MKKITLIAAAFIAVSFASCSKAKTCSCTTTSTSTNSGVSTSTSSSEVTSYDKISSSEANKRCPKTDTQTSNYGNNTQDVNTKTCTLS